MKSRGFTLIELLIAMSILVLIVSALYASFATVTNTMADVRVGSEEMRLRQFLERSFRQNLSALYADAQGSNELFELVGIDAESSDGPKDSLRFVSIAPLMGGTGLPGDLKEVRYEVLDPGDMNSGLGQAADLFGPPQRKMQATETPLIANNVVQIDPKTGSMQTDKNADSLFNNSKDTSNNNTDPSNQTNQMEQAPSWSVPIRTLDFAYFDGKEWKPDWNSLQLGRMPWCIRIRINFARTEQQLADEKSENFSLVDEPEFEVVVPLPVGMGRMQTDQSIEQYEEAQELSDEGIAPPGMSAEQAAKLGLQPYDPSKTPAGFGGDPITKRDLSRASVGVRGTLK